MSSFVKSFIKRLSHFFIDYPLLLIAGGLFVTALLTPGTITLFKNIKTDFASLLPDKYPSVLRVKEMGERFGSVKNIIIVFETNKKEIVAPLFAEFDQKIKMLEGVSRTRYQKPGYDFFKKNRILYLKTADLETLKDKIQSEIQKAKLGDLYIDFEDDGGEIDFKKMKQEVGVSIGRNLSSPYLTNDEESAFLFEVYPPPEAGSDVDFSKKFYAQVTRFVEEFKPQRYDPNLRVSYSGGVKGVVEEYNAIIKDLGIAGLISWVLILIFLLQYFRSIALTLVTFLPLIGGMVWSFGIAYYLVGQLNMITAFLFSVLAGLGIEIGIHFTTRYFEERREGKTPQRACEIMLDSTGRPAFVAALTTVTTMAVLLVSDFRGFSEFGGIMSIGVLLIFLSYMLLLGPFLVLMERWHIITNVTSSATHLVDPLFFMKRWTKMKYVIPILSLSFFLFAISLWSLFYHTEFDYNLAALKGRSKQERQVKEKTDNIYQAKSFPAIVWAKDSLEAARIKNHLQAYKKTDPTPTIDRVVTLADVVPNDQNKKLKILAEIKKLLKDPILKQAELDTEQQKMLKNLKEAVLASAVSMDDVPQVIKDFFYGQKKRGEQQFVFISPRSELDLDDGLQAIAFAEDTRDIRIENQTYHAVSHNLVFADLLIMLRKDMKIVVALAFLSAFVMLWLDFKKIRIAALVIFPLVMGITWMFGVMWWAGIKLTLFNIIVFPCLLGMSIDNATHIFYRIRETGIANMMQVLRLTGNAIVMSGITAIAGFAGLMAAHHGGLFSTGLLAVIGLTLTLISGLIFFPAFLQWLQEFKSQESK